MIFHNQARVRFWCVAQLDYSRLYDYIIVEVAQELLLWRLRTLFFSSELFPYIIAERCKLGQNFIKLPRPRAHSHWHKLVCLLTEINHVPVGWTKKIAVTLNPGSLRKHQREWSDQEHVKDDRQGSGCHRAVDRQLKLKDGDYLTKSLTIRVFKALSLMRCHMWLSWHNVITISPTCLDHCPRYPFTLRCDLDFHIHDESELLISWFTSQPPVSSHGPDTDTAHSTAQVSSWAWGRVMIPSESYLIKS